ncbi:hypothetical protein Nepgr_004971 [Nepenthes gracilis]|uniref:Uncharacterized protein n=1 Tax=Nepenthes gracilis TaxID=150966 RepID=A0AAD3XFZ8_NEPGR|nr:hypothetical protein Nepgr_004971 [Nepenthes gracilis]
MSDEMDPPRWRFLSDRWRSRAPEAMKEKPKSHGAQLRTLPPQMEKSPRKSPKALSNPESKNGECPTLRRP